MNFLSKRRGKHYGRFLKMIDNLQTPKYKTNHRYRSRFPLKAIYNYSKSTLLNCV